MRSRQEAVREAFQQILLNWPLGHKTSFFPKPIFQTHVGVLLEGPSRSEPIKTHVWLTVPAAALIPLFWPPAPSFVAPGVGGTLIRGRALRHHISPRPQTFRSRWIRSLKEAGHSWTQLVFSLLLDASELGFPLVRLRPPTAQRCTLFSKTARRGSGLRGLRNTLRFSPAARSPPLFDLSSPNTESLQCSLHSSCTAEILVGLPSRRGLAPM